MVSGSEGYVRILGHDDIMRRLDERRGQIVELRAHQPPAVGMNKRGGRKDLPQPRDAPRRGRRGDFSGADQDLVIWIVLGED